MTAINRSNLPMLTGLGMISGGVAWGLISLTSERSYMAALRGTNIEISALAIFPGLIFGLTFGLLWYCRGIASFASALGYTLASTIAYFLAFHLAINMFDRLSGILTENLALIVSGVSAGLLGSFLLGVGTNRLLRVRDASGLPVLIGSVAGALLPLINVFNDWNGGFLLFLAVWQGAYAAALAHVLRPGPATVAGAPSLESEKGRA